MICKTQNTCLKFILTIIPLAVQEPPVLCQRYIKILSEINTKINIRKLIQEDPFLLILLSGLAPAS